MKVWYVVNKTQKSMTSTAWPMFAPFLCTGFESTEKYRIVSKTKSPKDTFIIIQNAGSIFIIHSGLSST